MQEAPATTATTEAAGPGFPPFKPESFPSQIFWLVITMALLFVLMLRWAVPLSNATLSNRRAMIHKDIETAQENKRKAEQATVAYETPLFEARERARAMNNEYRDKAAADIKKAEEQADASAEKVTAEAEARLAKIRAEAKGHIVQAAQDATVEIVSRLTGQTISAEDAAAAVRATQES